MTPSDVWGGDNKSLANILGEPSDESRILSGRDREIMRLCARIISRIIGDLPHNWANPA